MITATPSTPGANALLEYYLQHGLNPVHYEMANQNWHFQRRASLYRSLGIHPATIRNARVLEVAVGTGQNSLYLASQRPRCFTLVEPNPFALKEIKALYGRPEYAAWRPEIVETTLQDFHPAELYDVIVCENWLGQTPSERGLIRKLGALVAPGGLLALTTVSPVGFLPNVLRRLLADRLVSRQQSFEERTNILVEAFGPHLATMAAMTRSSVDWVHDTVMNPHYLNICLSIPMVAEDLGSSMTFIGSSPDFAVDWRWFKSLYGDARQFNDHFLGEYYCNCHNFLDHRQMLRRAEPGQNVQLEDAACQLIATAGKIDGAARPDQVQAILTQLQTFLDALAAGAPESIAALREFSELYALPTLGIADVRNMKSFAGLFGRENVYVSLEKST
jgi:2-polyprenyl-3-methyl-5-hydroxy-6-metoxy-1,4-benzoquinol methylase